MPTFLLSLIIITEPGQSKKASVIWLLNAVRQRRSGRATGMTDRGERDWLPLRHCYNHVAASTIFTLRRIRSSKQKNCIIVVGVIFFVNI